MGAGWSASFHPASTQRLIPGALGRGYVRCVLLLMFFRRLRALATRDAGLPADEAGGSGLPGFVTALRGGPELSRVDVPPTIQFVRIIVLAMVVITVPLSTPNIGKGGQGLAVAVTLAVAAVAWVAWQFAGRTRQLWVILLVIMGAAGGALAGLSSLSTAVAVGFVVTGSAGAGLALQASVAVTAETIAAFFIAAIVSHAPIEAVIGWSTGFLGMWAFGLTRRACICAPSRPSRRLSRPAARTRPRRRRRLSPSGPGSPGRSTTSWRTHSPRSR